MVLDEDDPLYGTYTEFEEIDVTPKDTSRIAAQHAKAEINAIVRNAAREQIYEEFSKRIGGASTRYFPRAQTTPDFITPWRSSRRASRLSYPTSTSATLTRGRQ